MTFLFSMPGGAIWSIMGIALLIAIIPAIFYMLTLQNTLKAISPENRKMPPGNVWLLFIPLFNLIWHFIVVGNMADSIRAEADKKNIDIPEARPGYSIGLAMCVLQLCGLIPVLGSFTSIAALVCFIIYWTKIAGYKNKIEAAARFGVQDERDLLRM